MGFGATYTGDFTVVKDALGCLYRCCEMWKKSPTLATTANRRGINKRSWLWRKSALLYCFKRCLKGQPISISLITLIDVQYHHSLNTDDFICSSVSWWRHQMETFSALLALVRGIQRSQVNSPHKGHWPAAFMFSLICTWTNGWVNNQDAGDLRRHRAHCDVTIMYPMYPVSAVRYGAPFTNTGYWLTVISAWVSNHMPRIVWDGIT